MNEDLKNVDDFYKEFDETCTKKAVINELGKLYPYVYYIEVALIYLIVIGYYLYKFVKNGFNFEEFSLNSTQAIWHYVVTLIAFMFVAIVIIVVGEVILIKKIKKKNDITQTGYQLFFNTIRIPNVNKTIENLLEKNRINFLKKNMNSYSKDKVIDIYKFVRDDINNISLEISNKSNVGTYVSF